ncbi:MAG TPA: GNAT family N-acetyltransferase, partial [Paracoccaceae bacterium]
MTGLEFRDLQGLAEFRAAEAMQRTVWGQGDKEDPADLMMVIQQEGGIAAGAFDGGQLLGYVFGFPTRAPHVQHSHRLAVLPQGRGRGLGLRLKWFQREWCL